MAGNKGGRALAAGLTGALIGAAAGATAVALSDKKNRKMLQDKVTELRVQGTKKFEELRKKGMKQMKAGTEDQKDTDNKKA